VIYWLVRRHRQQQTQWLPDPGSSLRCVRDDVENQSAYPTVVIPDDCKEIRDRGALNLSFVHVGRRLQSYALLRENQAKSPDCSRSIPASVIAAQAASREPLRSMLRQASSMTETFMPPALASSADQATQKSVARPQT